MLVGQAVGVQMIVEGGNTFGAAGALKVPHALTLHAVQVLPALALLLLLSDSAERHRVRVVGVGIGGYAVLIAATLLQTYGGRAPLDPGPGRDPAGARRRGPARDELAGRRAPARLGAAPVPRPVPRDLAGGPAHASVGQAASATSAHLGCPRRAGARLPGPGAPAWLPGRRPRGRSARRAPR